MDFLFFTRFLRIFLLKVEDEDMTKPHLKYQEQKSEEFNHGSICQYHWFTKRLTFLCKLKNLGVAPSYLHLDLVIHSSEYFCILLIQAIQVLLPFLFSRIVGSSRIIVLDRSHELSQNFSYDSKNLKNKSRTDVKGNF